MWSRFLELVGRGYRNRAGADRVRRALETKYPQYEATDVWLRAREDDRDVLAVLYRERQPKTLRRGVPLYKLFAVRPDLDVEELPFDPISSPYVIRGVK